MRTPSRSRRCRTPSITPTRTRRPDSPMSSRRRVVVTGLGCVSPVGNTVAESWANLLAGKSGIDNITQFDAANFAVRFAGEAKGFDVAQYIPEKEARHMDRFIHLG